jgi:membrane protease subunit HflC
MDRRLNRTRIVLGFLSLCIIILSSATFMVSQGEAVIRIRLGEVQQTIQEPGLRLRLPWPVEELVRVDLRKRNFRSQNTEMLTKDNRNIILMSFSLWSVDDPLRFYQAVGSLEEGDEKLEGLITNAKISILGGYNLSALASTEEGAHQYAEIEETLQKSISTIAQEKYGMKIHDVGLSRLSLPKENISAVFRQMRAERKKYAATFKAEGAEQAAQIRSDTDVEVAKIKATATEEAAKIRGDAESEAAKIYAEAYKKDPELYRFVRSLDTLEDVLGTKSSVILRTDAEPFRLLREAE